VCVCVCVYSRVVWREIVFGYRRDLLPAKSFAQLSRAVRAHKIRDFTRPARIVTRLRARRSVGLYGWRSGCFFASSVSGRGPCQKYIAWRSDGVKKRPLLTFAFRADPAIARYRQITRKKRTHLALLNGRVRGLVCGTSESEIRRVRPREKVLRNKTKDSYVARYARLWNSVVATSQVDRVLDEYNEVASEFHTTWMNNSRTEGAGWKRENVRLASG